MTNRKHFVDGARLAQCVEHQTFNLRSICSSPISSSNRIPYVCSLYGSNIFLFMPIENVHHLSNFFKLMPVFFSFQYRTFYTRSLVQCLFVLE